MAISTKWTVAWCCGAALLVTALEWSSTATHAQRFPHLLALLIGACMNGLAAKLLKRLLNIRRPSGAALSDPGFPSSHAASLFFFAAALAGSARCSSDDAAALYAIAAALSYARVYAGLHTLFQVAGGALLGATSSALWRRIAVAPAALLSGGLIAAINKHLAALANVWGSDAAAVAAALLPLSLIGLFVVSDRSRRLFACAGRRRRRRRRRRPSAVAVPRVNTFAEFYPTVFLDGHQRPLTKLFHVVGTALGVWCHLAFAWGVLVNRADPEWMLIPMGWGVGYAMAFFSHSFIERNEPATLSYPLWAFIGDFKLCYEILKGQHALI